MDTRFDGDTASANIAISDEAVEAVEKFFRSREAYIGSNGEFIASTAVDTIDLVMYNMTGEPENIITATNQTT
jgi:hypothetical protein